MATTPISHLRRSFNFAVSILKTAALYHVVTTYGYDIYPAAGPSMLPTIDVVGEWLFVSLRHRYGRDVQVGDLIAYRIPVRHNMFGVKRVVGMPGDYVLMHTPEEGRDEMVQVPPGHCWITGDNLPDSRDSRDFGPLPLGLVKGKILGRLFPFRWIENGLVKA